MKSEKLRAIPHNFFGRISGHSLGLFPSLDCYEFVEDDPSFIEQSLRYVRDSIGAKKLITVKQVHGTKCLLVDENTESGLSADAMVTGIKEVALGVLTADCSPLLFFDSKSQIVGVAHCGWRGAVAGIIENTIKEMISLGGIPEDIIVAIGPCIHKENYEVSDDFLERFSEKHDCFSEVNGSIYFDLPGYCIYKLLDCGITQKNIDLINVDTFQDHGNYFSYRYAQKNSNGICGRNISVIRL